MDAERAALDFFISYTGENRGWAEWIAAQLKAAGYSTWHQAADIRAGHDFVHEMQQAVASAERTIAVLSPAYLRSQFGEAEWRVAFAQDPTGEKGLLIPVRVQPCDPPGLLISRVYVDLVDAAEDEAHERLLAAMAEGRPRPAAAVFPGGPRFPGAGPVVTNLPSRNRVFTGRDDLIMHVYEELRGESSATVVSSALHGLGGVGKSTTAVEYGHRYASDYDLVWWIDAEQSATVPAQVARLGKRLGLPDVADEQDAVDAVFVELGNRDRWLLIYDNAEQPSSVTPLIPAGGGGHVLVTSRWPDWRRHARVVLMTVWPRDDSMTFLRTRTRHKNDRLLGDLAELVGDLPLAVEEAAAYLEQTGEDLSAYVELVRDRARELFAKSHGVGITDERRVATVWTLSLDRVHVQEPVAEQLLNLLAFLAPQVPRDLVSTRPELLPEQLRPAVSDRLAYNRLLEAAGRYALIGLDPAEVSMHRLVQVIVQARLESADEKTWVAAAVSMISELFPAASWEPTSWPDCERLLPQVLAVTGHAERVHVSGEETTRLLAGASAFLRGRGQYLEAELLARRALTLSESVLGADHLAIAWRHDGLGRVLQNLGRLEEARAEFERALAIGLTARDTDERSIGVWRGNLGNVLQEMNLRDEALAEFEQSLAIGLATLGPDHPEIGIRRSNLGSLLRSMGRLDEAWIELKQALAISLAAHGPEHPTIGVRRNNLGNLLRALGRPDDARSEYQQALAISLAVLGPRHPEIGVRRSNLGSVLHLLGLLDEARIELEQALVISLDTLGPHHSQTRTIRLQLGHLLRFPAVGVPGTEHQPDEPTGG